jgi:hypothetical protein
MVERGDPILMVIAYSRIGNLLLCKVFPISMYFVAKISNVRLETRFLRV